MSTIDRAVHRHVPIDLSVRIRLSKNPSKDSIPGAIAGIAAMTLPHCLPRAETVPRQIPPRDPDPIAVHDSFDDLPIAAEPATALALIRRQQRRYPPPLLVSEHLESVPNLSHQPRMASPTTLNWETRPSPTDLYPRYEVAATDGSTGSHLTVIGSFKPCEDDKSSGLEVKFCSAYGFAAPDAKVSEVRMIEANSEGPKSDGPLFIWKK